MAQTRKSRADVKTPAPQPNAAAPAKRQKRSPEKEDHPQAGKGRHPRQQPDQDNALESLGKAVSAPVLGAADEDPDKPV